MISKKEATQILNKYLPIFIKSLGMSKYTINLHITRSTSKEFKMFRPPYNSYDGSHGWSFSADKCGEIFIFIDKHSRVSNLVGTLFHELLHVRIYALTSLITINANKGHREEEKFIRDLEKIFSRRKKLRF